MKLYTNDHQTKQMKIPCQNTMETGVATRNQAVKVKRSNLRKSGTRVCRVLKLHIQDHQGKWLGYQCKRYVWLFSVKVKQRSNCNNKVTLWVECPRTLNKIPVSNFEFFGFLQVHITCFHEKNGPRIRPFYFMTSFPRWPPNSRFFNF